MRVHVIRHVAFEGPGFIADWAVEQGHMLAEFLGITEAFPSLEDVDFLVVLGGPMDADDHDASPWLTAEKDFIRAVIARGVPVLGVCLGAQILAEICGGTVLRGEYPEIGWYPVRRTDAGAQDPVFSAFPDVLIAGHWHGDTFSLPDGIMPAVSSDATANQAFSVNGGRVVGVQFHLEWDRPALERLVDTCSEDLTAGGPYVMIAPDLLGKATNHIDACRSTLFDLLNRMAALGPEGDA